MGRLSRNVDKEPQWNVRGKRLLSGPNNKRRLSSPKMDGCERNGSRGEVRNADSHHHSVGALFRRT